MNITKREQEILEYIVENPFISQSEIANRANITRSSVAVHIRNLTTKGFLKGRAYVLPKDYYALAIGNASIAMYGTLDGKLKTDTNAGQIVFGTDGAARNVAETLSRIGIPTELFTAIGLDDHGKNLRLSLNEENIPFRESLTSAEISTSVELSILSDRKNDYSAVSDAKIIDMISPTEIEKRRDYIKGAKAIFVDDCLRQDTIEYLSNNFSAPLFISFRTVDNIPKFQSVLHRVQGAGVDMEQLSVLTGRPILKYKDVREGADFLLKKGVKEIFVALDTGGAYFTNGIISGRIPTMMGDIAFWNGLGETFAAGLIRGYIQSLGVKRTAEIALVLVKSSTMSPFPVNRALNEETLTDWVNEVYPSKETKEEKEDLIIED